MGSMPEGDIGAADGALLEELTTIVSEAAAAILAVRAGALDARSKADRSPVTAADHAAEAVILENLARLLPGVPVVSEEAAARVSPTALADSFVLVDPLDGTRELVAGRDEFTVNVAIVTGGRPVLGIVAAPALAMVWRAAERRAGRAPASFAGSAGERRAGAQRYPLPALAGQGTHRHRQPIPSRRPHPSLSVAAAAGRGAGQRLRAEILPGRRGRSRPLSAARADLRVGRGRRPCGVDGCRRDRDHTGRRAAALWPDRRKLWHPGFHCLGRSIGSGATGALTKNRVARKKSNIDE